MDFPNALQRHRVILAEGAVIERLRHETDLALDPHALHAGWVLDAAGRRALRGVYREYLAVGRRYDRPLILGAPTWRASPERLQRAGIDAGVRLNTRAVTFLKELRDEDQARAYVAGMIACRHDAYRPQEALDAATAERFHAPQAEALAAGGPDLILAATLPARSEAAGMARALAATGVPYLVSFVIRPDGRLLDGNLLDAAMASIDDAVAPTPAGYMVNCVHPDHVGAALAAVPPSPRLLGIQGNASRLSPEELDGRAELDRSPPDEWAAATVGLHRRYGLRILGGCCGTDARHIRAVAAALAAGSAG